MATKKKTVTPEDNSLAIQDERSLMGPIKIVPATLVDDAVEVAKLEGLPEEFGESETMAGFPPSPKFEKKGEAVFGSFIRYQAGVGPNKSRLYELAVPNGEASLNVAVWGSTALDRLWDSAFPPIQQGDRVAIIYLGSKPTPRNQNPVKLFALKVKRMTIG